jgi:hypothetical protein
MTPTNALNRALLSLAAAGDLPRCSDPITRELWTAEHPARCSCYAAKQPPNVTNAGASGAESTGRPDRKRRTQQIICDPRFFDALIGDSPGPRLSIYGVFHLVAFSRCLRSMLAHEVRKGRKKAGFLWWRIPITRA